MTDIDNEVREKIAKAPLMYDDSYFMKQRDADHEYYLALIQSLIEQKEEEARQSRQVLMDNHREIVNELTVKWRKVVEQAKQEVAREILTKLEDGIYALELPLEVMDLTALLGLITFIMSHYLGNKGEGAPRQKRAIPICAQPDSQCAEDVRNGLEPPCRRRMKVWEVKPLTYKTDKDGVSYPIPRPDSDYEKLKKNKGKMKYNQCPKCGKKGYYLMRLRNGRPIMICRYCNHQGSVKE